MNPHRTPKAGEHWIWKPCEKHRFKQLSDVVVCCADFEDLSQWAQDDIMEHIWCGCQYPADDPQAAILALRIEEAEHRAEMLRQVALIDAYTPRPTEVSPWWAVAVILAAIAAALCFVVH